MNYLASHTKHGWIMFLSIFTAVWLGLAADGHGAGFIKFDGIDGEATDPNHQGWIDIQSVDHQILRIIEQSGAELQRSSVDHKPFKVRHRVDKASPLLMDSCTTGRIIPRAIIEYQEDFGNPLVWKRIVFENVMILSTFTSYGSGQTLEEVTFNYERIHWRYVPYPIPGEPNDPVEFGWNLISENPFEPDLSENQATPTPTQITEVPTPTPIIDPTLPTPTPIIDPTLPTPTPIIDPTLPTPTPPPIVGNQGIALQTDIYQLMDERFVQESVVIQEAVLEPLSMNIREMYQGQFYPMLTLPDGTVLTAMLTSNIPAHPSSTQDNPTMLLVIITDQGELAPFAEKIIPDVLADDELLTEVETILINMTYGKDQLKVLTTVRGLDPTSFERMEFLVLTNIEGPFNSTYVENFDLY